MARLVGEQSPSPVDDDDNDNDFPVRKADMEKFFTTERYFPRAAERSDGGGGVRQGWVGQRWIRAKGKGR